MGSAGAISSTRVFALAESIEERVYCDNTVDIRPLIAAMEDKGRHLEVFFESL